jgi:Protein of unknown function (DUF1679)
MYTEPPRTLIHNDVQGDNLLVAKDGEPSLAVVDWQLTTAARAASDLARFLVGYLDTTERRRHENRLLDMYHSVLIECGVAGYSTKQCWDDYCMALVLAASRLATAVGFHPGLTATPDGFWNVVFPRATPRRWPIWAWPSSSASITASPITPSCLTSRLRL